MNLVIHDMNETEWNEVSGNYKGWEKISDNGSIKPCVGCFGCWVKEPGQCVIKDGYDHMGSLIHNADEVVVISRYTYGGLSSFVKNVFDRSIGFISPFFEVYEDEMHHTKRYPEEKPFTFIFRKSSFTDEEKERAKAYVEAVRRNLRGRIKEIRFEEKEPVIDGIRRTEPVTETDKIILLNSSLRGNNSNTNKFFGKLETRLNEKAKLINLSSYVASTDELVKTLLSAKTIVLGMPLYVDGIPSQVLRIMESMEKTYNKGKKNIYVLANMGMYESSQIKNLLGMVKSWCDECGFDYCGGVAIGSGEMMGMFMDPNSKGMGPAKLVTEGLYALADAINSSSKTEDIYADAYRFPRWMYMFAANSGWPKAGKLNGLKKKDLLQQR